MVNSSFFRQSINYNNMLFQLIPFEVVIDEILPFLSHIDILNCSSTSAHTRDYCNMISQKYLTAKNISFPDFPVLSNIDLFGTTMNVLNYVERSRKFSSLDKEHDLTIACAHGDLGSVKRILSIGVDIDCIENTMFIPVNSGHDNQRNLSPLEYAAIEGHVEVVSFLLEHGARYDRTKGVDELDISTIIDIIFDHASNGLTKNQLKCLKLIFEKMVADVNFIPFYWCYRIVVPNHDFSSNKIIHKELLEPLVQKGKCIGINGPCGSCYSDLSKNRSLHYDGVDSKTGITKFICRNCVIES